MKKKTVLILIAVFVLAVLVGATVWLAKTPSSSEPSPQPTTASATVYKAESEQLSEIRFDYKDGTPSKALLLKKNQNSWQIDGVDPQTTDEAKISSLAATVSTVTSKNYIETDPSDLAQYGLDDPSITVSLTDQQGTVDTLFIGDLSPTLGEYFIMQKDVNAVYTINSYKVDSIRQPVSYYQEFNRFKVTTADITGIKMERAQKDTVELKIKDTVDENTIMVWEMSQPYPFTVNASDDYIDSQILQPLEEISLTTLAPEGTNTGLDSPSAVLTLTVTPYDNETKQESSPYEEVLKLGKTENNKIYVGYKNQAFITDSALFSFVSIDAFQFVNKLQAMVNITDVSKVTVTGQGQSTSLDIEHVDGDYKFKLDGKDADYKLSKMMYQGFIGLSVDAEYHGEALENPEITLYYEGYQGADNVTVELQPVNELYYAVTKNGDTQFVIKRNKVEDMMKALDTFKANPQG
jgi:hypothetical protein